MASVEIIIALPPELTAHHLRAEGRRFGLHKAAHAEQIIRDAHASGVLTDDVVDRALLAVDHDIRKTVQELSTQVPAAKRAIFEAAARRAYARHMKALQT